MSETEIKDKLGAYLDGELDPETRRLVEAGLERSPELREELERLRRTSGSLRRHFRADEDELVDPQGEGIALERIVRMSTQELRRGDIASPRRRSPLMILALLLVLAGLLVLVLRPILAGGPAAEELVGAASAEVERGFIELDLVLAGLLPDLVALMPQSFGFDRFASGRLRLGPGGLGHLGLGRDPDTEDFLVQAGRDRTGAWILLDPAGPVRRLRDFDRDGRTRLVGRLLGFGDALRAVLDEARRNPRALELVGRVEDELGRELWKVRLGGGRAERNATFWFDDEGRLDRVALAGIEARVRHEASLTPADFELDEILPGHPVEGDER